jgi:hypothetical protein
MTLVKQSNDKKNLMLFEGLAQAIVSLDIENNNHVKILEEKDSRYITRLKKLFNKILQNVKIYKRFLPKSLYDISYMESDGSTAEMSSGELKNVGSSICSDSLVSKISYKNTVRNVSETSSQPDSSNNFSVLTNKFKNIINSKTKRKLEFREITLVNVNISNFTELIYKKSLTVIEEFISNYIKIATEASNRHTGVVEYSGKDNLSISFNTVTRKIEHCKNAVLVADEIKNNMGTNLSIDNIIPKFRICIVIGKCMCGNVGTDSYTRYSILGEPKDLSIKISRHMKKLEERYNLENEIIITADVKDFLIFKIDTLPIDIIEIEKVEKDEVVQLKEMKEGEEKGVKKTKTHRLYRVSNVLKENEKGEEWMYEIGYKIKNSNTVDHYKNAWNFYIKGENVKAKESLKRFMVNNKKDKYAKILYDKLYTNL